MPMTTEQLTTKIAYLERENTALRSQLLDSRILSGEIRLETPTTEGDTTHAEQ